MSWIAVLCLGAFAGLLGASAMNVFMRAVSKKLGSRGDMIRALGSFYTRSQKNAATAGNIIHSLAGIAFGMIYVAVMHLIGALHFPQALFLGLGFGLIHGIIASYALMFYASERHPLEEYRKATMEEGVLHFFGHILYGFVTGLVGGLVAQGFAA